MAVDTAPAAVPGPDEQPATGTGFLASMLTPVEPARPLTAAATVGPVPSEAPGSVPASMSSAAFHETPDNTPEKEANSAAGTRSNSGTRPKESVIRAWLLAGAERWKKGAGANIKRLEVKKAQAAADAALARKQPVNPAPKQSSGTTSAGSKNPAPKPAPSPKAAPAPRTTPAPAPKPSPVQGPKSPAPAPAPKAPAPKTSPSPAPSPAPKKTELSKSTAPAPAPKKPADKTTTTTNPAPAPKPAPQKPAPSPMKTSKDSTAPSGSSGPHKAPSSPQKSPTGSSSGTAGGTSKGSSGKSSDGSSARGDGRTPEKPTSAKGKSPGTGAGTGPTVPAPRTGDSSTGKSGPEKDPKSSSAPDPKKAGPDTGPKPAGDTAAKKSTADTDGKNPGPDSSTLTKPSKTGPMLTRDARETGYRDGHRAGRAAAKGRAYGHGFQDGWTSALGTADDEKKLLDRARDLRKEDRKEPPMPTAPTIPPKPTQPPAPAPAAPLTVAAVDDTTVVLGPDADRTSMTRGEVRTLKGFERRLTDHHNKVQTVAEATRGLALHASLQAEQVTQLLEQAKGVKGGDKLLATLTRLQDAAQAQVLLAQEVHTRAVRGADATGAVLANTMTRYGSLYQAVVDSDETKPAELAFYKG